MNNNPMQMPQQMAQMVNQLRQNPVQFLMQRKLNIPQNMANDPQGILNHLLQTGQISQDQINQAYQMAQRFRR